MRGRTLAAKDHQQPADAGPQRPLVVREVNCKTVLNRSSLGQYSMNCYTGCRHGCVYCYARFMQRFHPHAEPWGEFVDVKVNAPDALARQLTSLLRISPKKSIELKLKVLDEINPDRK